MYKQQCISHNEEHLNVGKVYQNVSL